MAAATQRRPSMSQWNEMNPLASDWSSDVYSGWRSPKEEAMLNAPLTDDQYVLLLNKKNSDKVRKTRVAGDIVGAQDEEAFLRSITPEEIAGIHSAPTTPRQARLQALLNQDYLARERGSQLSLKGMQDNERKAFIYQGRQLQLNQDALQRAKFESDKKNDAFRQNLDTLKYKADRGDESAKREYQNQILGLQKDQFNRRQQLDENSLKFQTSRDQRADKNSERNSFLDVFSAVKQGVIDPSEALASGDWTPQQEAVLRGYIDNHNLEGEMAGRLADQYNARLKSAVPTPYTPKDKRWFGIGDAPTAIPPTAEEIQQARLPVIRDYQKDPRARKYLVYDPESDSFVPVPKYSGRIAQPTRRAGNRFADSITGSSVMDSPSGPMPDSGSYADALDQPTRITDQSGNPMGYFPPVQGGQSSSNFVYGAPPQNSQIQPPPQNNRQLRDGLYPSRDGYIYRVVNGVPQRTNLRIPR